MRAKTDSSRKGYKSTLNKYNQYLKKNHSTDILRTTDLQITEYIEQFEYKKTKETYLKIIKGFMNWLVKEGYISKNPAEDIKVHNGKKKEHFLITVKDFQQMLNTCDGLRERTIISFMYYTGVRAMELVNIRDGDINFTKKYVRIEESKTSTGIRNIPIHPNLRMILMKYIKIAQKMKTDKGIDHSFLFMNKHGNPLKKRTIQRMVQRVAENKFAPHDFRRAFITNVYRQSKNLVLCQKLAGHSEITTTRGYIIDDYENQSLEFNSLNF
ncbi:MAG: tyrosine-type recombinase/integrase [Candidatus Heimdallarchaeota archaeon]|nr:tyrosine-type recombinase/integrase [Candidatus Heimdallarchaeota archaeon]